MREALMIMRVSAFKAKPGADVDELHSARDEAIAALRRAPGLRYRHFFGFKDADGQQWGASITIWDGDASHPEYVNAGHDSIHAHWNDEKFKQQRPDESDAWVRNIPFP
jgi:hypothetical protein